VSTFYAEYQQSPSTDGSLSEEWILTDVAHSRNLGTTKRVSGKMEKLLVASTGDRRTLKGVKKDKKDSREFIRKLEEPNFKGKTVNGKAF
jgi:hypothetical protein